jgi:iron complex outermembrane receptor protein
MLKTIAIRTALLAWTCVASVSAFAIADASEEANISAGELMTANGNDDLSTDQGHTNPARRNDNSQTLEEVVVTARKREESVQRVPESIVAISEASIKQQQITSTRDLQQVVPGFSVQTGIADVFTGLYSLRGLSMLNIGQNTDPTTATYVDGVYQGLSASNLGQEDLQSIQVLQGPQGTLFGRNATGGAILINHNLPSDHFEGWVRGGYGNYNQYNGEGLLNIPLGSEAGLRVVGGYLGHSGFGNGALGGGAFNAMTEPDFTQFGGTFAGANCSVTPCRTSVDNLQAYNAHATLELKPTSDLDIIFRAGYIKGQSTGAGGGITYLAPLGVGAFEAGSELGIPGYAPAVQAFLTPAALGGCGGSPVGCAAFGTLAAAIPTIQGALASRTAGNLLNAVVDVPGIDRASKVTASATITWNTNADLQLKSITGFVNGKRFLQQDLDNSSFSIETSLQDTRETLITEELQAVGNALAERLKYTVGAYYYHKDAMDNQAGFTAPLLFIVPQSLFGITETASSPSGYGQATYTLTPQINITGGVRYTTETKNLHQQNYAPFFLSFLNPGGVPLGTPLANIPFSSYDNNVSYLGEIDYSPLTNVMTYFKTSDGFRSGGPQETAPAGFASFQPEQVTDYELGVKSEWFDDRLHLNADIYREIYKNVQQTLFFTGAGGNLVNAVANVGDARIDGFELQIQAIPLENLTLSASLGLMDPRYTSVSAVAIANGITVDSPFANVQRSAYTFSGNYLVRAAAGDINLHADWHWQSTTHETPGFTAGPTGQNFTAQDPYGILNGRITFTPGNRDWEIALWGKNLTNRQYITYIFNSTGTPTSPGGLGFIDPASAATPRSYGADITWSF